MEGHPWVVEDRPWVVESRPWVVEGHPWVVDPRTQTGCGPAIETTTGRGTERRDTYRGRNLGVKTHPTRTRCHRDTRTRERVGEISSGPPL